MQQKTIFLNFYQTKDYFFWLDNKNKRFLRTIYLFLRNSRSMPPDVFLKNDKHLFRRTPLGDCFWNIWKCSPLLFCYFTILPEAVSQMCSSNRTLPKLCQITDFLWPIFSRTRTESTKIEARILLYFLQWDKHLFGKTLLGTASGTFGNYFSVISPFFWRSPSKKLQKQPPRGVSQKRHCRNYVRLWVFSDPYFPV